MKRAMMAPRPSLAGDWGELMPPVACTPFPESTRYRCASHSPDFWHGLNGPAVPRPFGCEGPRRSHSLDTDRVCCEIKAYGRSSQRPDCLGAGVPHRS
jgi:hypothetical protein